MKIPSRNLIHLFALTVLVGLAASSWAELIARVDRSTLDSGETLQLVVRYDGQVISSEPDFSMLENDFEILSNSRQQQYSWVNGQAQSYTDWTMVLLPKRVGEILVPSISFKNDVSNALEITVRAAANSSAGAGEQPIYTETMVDKDSVYIQEQIILTQRLYTSVQLQDLTLSDLAVPEALVQRLGERQFQKMINGRNYLVVEVSYALFPQTSGKLDIPALRFGAFESTGRRQFGAFSSRGNQLFRTTDPKTIDVMARPAHIPLENWMPATQLELSEQWSSDLSTMRVGEPITRTITIRAQGLTGAQIQPLDYPDRDDYKSYPDQPRVDDQITENGVQAVRTETIAMVPNRAGEMQLPAIQVRWWNTNKQRMETTSLSSKTVQVQPAPPIQTNSQPLFQPEPLVLGVEPNQLDNQPSQPSALTQWSLALNALLVAVVIALLARDRSLPKTRMLGAKPVNSAHLSLKQKLKMVETQADSNDLAAVRDSILNWGREMFPEAKPNGLTELAEQLGDPQVKDRFAALDRQLYKGGGDQEPVDLKLLVKQLRSLSAGSGTMARQKTKGQPLKPLYPK
jgi:hypothetical protein